MASEIENVTLSRSSVCGPAFVVGPVPHMYSKNVQCTTSHEADSSPATSAVQPTLLTKICVRKLKIAGDTKNVEMPLEAASCQLSLFRK